VLDKRECKPLGLFMLGVEMDLVRRMIELPHGKVPGFMQRCKAVQRACSGSAW
jgi:hypothetical protein